MKNQVLRIGIKNHNTAEKIFSRLAIPMIFIGLALALSGCMGVYEGGFECPPGEGVGCKSISDVNEMINQDMLPRPKDKKKISDVDAKEGNQNSPCGKGSTCPLKPDSWYWVAPGALLRV